MGTPVGGVWIRQSVRVAGADWRGGPCDLFGGTMRASLAIFQTSDARHRNAEFCGETAPVGAAKRQSTADTLSLSPCSRPIYSSSCTARGRCRSTEAAASHGIESSSMPEAGIVRTAFGDWRSGCRSRPDGRITTGRRGCLRDRDRSCGSGCPVPSFSERSPFISHLWCHRGQHG